VRTVVGVLVGVAALVGLLLGMAELTQNRPDVVRDGSRTTVTFEVATRDVERGEPAAAAALWAVCAGTVGGEVSAVPSSAGCAWRVTIAPAIGEHGENRLVGCLEDLTVDRVIGDVVAVVST
jgi:hypothetical protein